MLSIKYLLIPYHFVISMELLNNLKPYMSIESQIIQAKIIYHGCH